MEVVLDDWAQKMFRKSALQSPIIVTGVPVIRCIGEVSRQGFTSYRETIETAEGPRLKLKRISPGELQATLEKLVPDSFRMLVAMDPIEFNGFSHVFWLEREKNITKVKGFPCRLEDQFRADTKMLFFQS